MPRYIDADKVEKWSWQEPRYSDSINDRTDLRDFLRSLPTISPDEVRGVGMWISVEDEPPKENGRYLVRYKRDVNLGDEETVHEDEIRIMRFFVDDGWCYPIICNDHVRLVNEEVTHWMPLPRPMEVSEDA